jgi:hypothetical protein
MDKLVKLIQKRIANTSVGASTVRGQPKNTAQNIRIFLKNIDVFQFSQINQEQEFQYILNQLTNNLIEKMPNGNFGFARKCLNIFLFEICHNTVLVKKYGLDKIIPYLEVPLDNPNEKKLRKEAKEQKNWNWSSIKKLEFQDSEKIQAFAKKYMKKEHGFERVYFDLINWRNLEE